MTFKMNKLFQHKFALPSGQITLLAFLFCAGFPLILATLQQAAMSAVLIYIFVGVVGLLQCHSTQQKLSDSKLRWLGYFWLTKLGLTLFLLYAGWIPQLDPDSSSSWGYDPQRYYWSALHLVENNWIPVVGLNYQGIVFYYAVIFYLFGHNPVIPALVNAFVTLLGTLFLIRVSYEFKEKRDPRDWTLAFALLIPEMVWYDVMTSRETLMAVLVLVASLSAGRYIVRSGSVSFTTTAWLVGASLLAILVVRPFMAIPVMASIILMTLLGLRSSKTTLLHLTLFGLVGILLTASPMIQDLSGGYDMESLIAHISGVSSFQDNVASRSQDWSEQSIGLLLAPNTLGEGILYLPLRMILYLVAPLPNVTLSISGLFTGSWSAWQQLMVLPSSVMNIVAIPSVGAGFIYSLRHRRHYKAPLVMYITYFMTFISIAGGNIIIHERYRLMATLLLASCAWFGATVCTKQLITQLSFLWYGILAAGAIFYFAYKGL